MLPDSEIYDQSTNEWNPASPMAVPVIWHDSIPLSADLVLDVSHLASQLYDAATDEWAVLPPTRWEHGDGGYASLNLLQDARVLVVGATSVAPLPPEIFDPETQTWSDGPELNGPRMAPKSVVLDDGTVLIAGGYDHQECMPEFCWFAETATAEIGQLSSMR